jgi:hypothetical protein
MDPDPGGPKTYGSGPGSATLERNVPDTVESGIFNDPKNIQVGSRSGSNPVIKLASRIWLRVRGPDPQVLFTDPEHNKIFYLKISG